MRPLILLITFFITIASCKAPKNISAAKPTPAREIPDGSTGGSEKLFASKWILYEADGVTLMPSVNSRPATLLFYPGQVSRVTGSTGCNTLTGTFDLSATHGIQFQPIATTKMMCPPDGNSKEKRMLKALKETNIYYFTADNLVLANGSTPLAKFKPEASPEQK